MKILDTQLSVDSCITNDTSNTREKHSSNESRLFSFTIFYVGVLSTLALARMLCVCDSIGRSESEKKG